MFEWDRYVFGDADNCVAGWAYIFMGTKDDVHADERAVESTRVEVHYFTDADVRTRMHDLANCCRCECGYCADVHGELHGQSNELPVVE